MCYIPKNVYTVCAHTRVGELVACARQKVRNARLEDGNWCTNFQLTFRSCRPVELAKLKYWFCPECREHYKGYDTNGAEAILNYWAYKALSGFTYSVSPGAIPADVVFNGTVPALARSTRVRCELIALDKAWPNNSPFETKVEWLQRLERARTVTLELARSWSGTQPCVQGSEISIQPRVPSPMTAYPFSYVHDHALNTITEASDSLKSAANPPSWRETIDRETPQVHLNTLARLCGMTPLESLPPRSEQAQRSISASPTLFEVPLDLTEPWGPLPVDQEMVGEESHHASVALARPLSRQLTEQFNQQQHNIQSESFNDGSGEASRRSNGNVPGTKFGYWDHEAWVDDPTDAASVEPTQESLGNEAERSPQADDEWVDDRTNSFSAEPVQNSPYRDPAERLETDVISSHEAFANVTLDGANVRDAAQEYSEPNTTSRFSVSEFDADEAGERASIASVSSVAEDEVPALDDSDTASPVSESGAEQEYRLPEQRKSIIDALSSCSTPEIVSPEPNRIPSPPRFVREDNYPATESLNSDAYWNDFGNGLSREASMSPGMVGSPSMMGLSPQSVSVM
ncbi:uncharacterized protein B0H64DRAFT_370901 [Chaetomium fimeti]|uniref:Uncharacterized protein n=1 Tax=Chaetomium fimeti TaxID=1854472 RepID=A0AAE0HKU6_9PEZI|nr:hypothetical protein B0H64DRAFT_370901 [Chaetomium fimeti]